MGMNNQDDMIDHRGETYQLQKATRKPNQENVKTRPYTLTGFRTGIDLALWLAGLTSGARQSSVMSTIVRGWLLLNDFDF
jgi:hypothetical protein